jgi:ABC-2 type transport system ATP-binding protein
MRTHRYGVAVLELAGIVRRFGDRVALDGVSLTVGDSEVVGFVGRNGAGKTTAMRVAMGLLEPDAGQVLWNGRLITEGDRRRIGYMPEERGLYPKMKVGDQLAYFSQLAGVPRRSAKESALALLERLGLSERADDFVEKLSLGNQQRVQLAASLVGTPELLILDEPFSGLDPIGVDALTNVIEERLDDGVGLLFSSHQLELLERLADRVVMIEAGRIVLDERIDPDAEPGSLAARFRERIGEPQQAQTATMQRRRRRSTATVGSAPWT